MLTTQDILQHLLPTFPDHAWLARLVEVAPGVRDAQIIAVTAGLEHLLGFHWPDTLVGAYMSHMHPPDDTHRVRQYAALRLCGVPVVTDYMLHILHPSGRVLRVVKHVNLRRIYGLPCWLTCHARVASSAHTPVLPDPARLLQQHPEAQRMFTARSMAELLTPGALQPASVLSCQKCGHTWYRRQAHEPRQCPRCKNPQWRQPRQRQRSSRQSSPRPPLA
jgi:hypothetical protein